MKIQTTKETKIKSLTRDGEKAITRSLIYNIDDEPEVYYIQFKTLLFSIDPPDNENEIVRFVGDKYVILREWAMKFDTLSQILFNQGVISKIIK